MTDPSYEILQQQPEVLSSQEIFELLKPFEGRELAPSAALYVGRRGAKNADKGLSTDVADGRFALFTPGVEHPGYERPKLTYLTTKSLLTLIRHALNPELGETKAAKSDDYKKRQESVANNIIEAAVRICFVDNDGSIQISDGKDSSGEVDPIYEGAMGDTIQEYLDFMTDGLRDDVSEDEQKVVVNSFGNLLKLVAELNAKGNPSE